MSQETVRLTVPAHTSRPHGTTVARAAVVERVRFGPGVPPVETDAAVAPADPRRPLLPRAADCSGAIGGAHGRDRGLRRLVLVASRSAAR